VLLVLIDSCCPFIPAYWFTDSGDAAMRSSAASSPPGSPHT
jgi:hypothetical protein